jgi:hypothetical protein
MSSMSVPVTDMNFDSENHENQKKEKNRQYTNKYRMKNAQTPLFKLRKFVQNQKRKRKEENQILTSENEGFKSRDGLLKKRRKLEEHLPKNPTRAAQVINELSKKYPLNPINGNSSDKIKPLNETEKRVKAFYENEENVVILPGSNDYVVRRDESNKKIKMQKHILKDSTKSMFKKFKVRKLSCKSNKNF